MEQEERKSVQDFIEHVFVPELQWVCWTCENSVLCSTIDTKRVLELVLRLQHPYRDSKYANAGVVRWRTLFERFDPAIHYHWYELMVKDPLFRWGRKVLLNLKKDHNDELYVLLKRRFELARSASREIPKSRKFEQKNVAIDAAISELY